MNTDFEKSLSDLTAGTPKSAEEIDAWKWQNEIVPHLTASGLPPRFHQIITEWPQSAQRKVLERTEAKLTGTGAIVALVGLRGAGKTTVAAQVIVKRALNTALPPWHRRPPYRKLGTLVARFKANYSDFGSIDAERMIQHLDSLTKDHPLVVIDEIHDCEDQKARDRFLIDFIDRRYANLVDTILISNQTVQDFQRTIGESILSRLSEHGAILACNWSSFRSPKP